MWKIFLVCSHIYFLSHFWSFLNFFIRSWGLRAFIYAVVAISVQHIVLDREIVYFILLATKGYMVLTIISITWSKASFYQQPGRMQVATGVKPGFRIETQGHPLVMPCKASSQYRVSDLLEVLHYRSPDVCVLFLYTKICLLFFLEATEKCSNFYYISPCPAEHYILWQRERTKKNGMFTKILKISCFCEKQVFFEKSNYWGK